MLEKALRSCLEQPGDFEILVSENASADGSREWLAGLSDPRVRVIQHSTTVDLWSNHNRCLKDVRTPWMMYLHSDEILESGAIASLFRGIDLAEELGASIIIPPERLGDSAGFALSFASQGLGASSLLSASLIGMFNPSGLVFRTSDLIRMDGFVITEEPLIHIERDLVARMAEAGMSWVVIPQNCVTAEQHGGQDTWRCTRRMWKRGDEWFWRRRTTGGTQFVGALELIMERADRVAPAVRRIMGDRLFEFGYFREGWCLWADGSAREIIRLLVAACRGCWFKLPGVQRSLIR